MLAIQVYLRRPDIRNIPSQSTDKDRLNINIQNEETLDAKTIYEQNRKKTSISLKNYKLNKKLNYIYTFLLHCSVLIAAGLFSKYAFSEELVDYTLGMDFREDS
jgi:hypothetical protein